MPFLIRPHLSSPPPKKGVPCTAYYLFCRIDLFKDRNPDSILNIHIYLEKSSRHNEVHTTRGIPAKSFFILTSFQAFSNILFTKPA